MGQRKDVAKMIRQACRQGYSVDKSSKHWKVKNASGRVVAGISATPSDPWALHRIKRDLRRAGVQL